MISRVHPALLLATLVACSGTHGGGVSSPARTAAHSYAEAEAEGDWDESPAPASESSVHADSARGGASQPVARSRQQPRHQVEERPGLGTVFGETVDSHVRRRPFTRATSSPFTALALHYNDAAGVRAHASYAGAAHLDSFYTQTPGGGITISLTDERGNVLPGGTAAGRAFIIGAEGQRYNIVIHNQTGGRFEVVASVDGLDVVDGRPAAIDKRGYIVEPYSALTIDGFRRSEYAVAAFRFGRVSQSYAARTSGDRNVGVIGIAFFAEYGSAWTSDELHRRDTADPFPGSPGYAVPPS